MDLEALLPDVVSWARAAGAIQLSYFRTDRLDTRAKLNDADIVTAACGIILSLKYWRHIWKVK